jgi:hypothetical protein
MTLLIPMRRALEDPDLFGRILSGESWRGWRVLLIAAMGKPPPKRLGEACQAFKAFIG